MSQDFSDGVCYSRLGGAEMAAPGSFVLVRRRVYPHHAADLRRGHPTGGMAAPVRPRRALDARPPMRRDLATHEPLPLVPHIAKQIRGIIEAADREKGVA